MENVNQDNQPTNYRKSMIQTYRYKLDLNLTRKIICEICDHIKKSTKLSQATGS